MLYAYNKAVMAVFYLAAFGIQPSLSVSKKGPESDSKISEKQKD
jgi:hypothetical protein